MRAATNNTSWLINDQGNLMGLSLGSDACAEHECGLKGVKRALGIPSHMERGLLDRVNTKTPSDLVYGEALVDGEKTAWLVFGDDASARFPQSLPPHLISELQFMSWGGKRATLACAWDENGIAVRVRGEPDIAYLKAFHQSILDSNLALGGALVDRNAYPQAGGLMFVRSSMVEPAQAASVLAGDQSASRLREAASKIGIEHELRQAGRRWHALSPRWKDEAESEVVFWLNPADQSDHSAGQFSVDELRQWARGEGPVMIDKALVAKQRQHRKELDRLQLAIRKAGFEPPYLSIEWKDASKGQIQVRKTYYTAPGKKPRMEEGVGDLEELQAQYPKPSPAHRPRIR